MSQPAPAGQGQSKSAKRRRNRRNNQVDQRSSIRGMIPITTSSPTANDLFARPSRKTMGSRINMPQMSEAGSSFLKSVFAAPDFAGQGAFLGIPDDISSIVCPYRHILTGDFWTILGIYGNSNDLIECNTVAIIQPPTPGYAFWFAPLKPGQIVNPTTIFHGVPYDDFKSLFGNDPLVLPPTYDVNEQVTDFRCAGNSFELICTSNAFQWRGSIRAFKLKLQYADTGLYAPDSTVPTFQTTKAVTGIEGVNATSAAAFVTPANLGVYMTAVNTEATFMSSSIPDKMWNINGNSASAYGIFEGIFTGFGTLETNVILLENIKVADQEPNPEVATLFQIRSWSMNEYKPQPSSLLYRSAHPSPPLDTTALNVYRSVVADLPVAVTYFENDSFWKRLMNTLGKIGGWLSNVPGPVGLISGGVGTLASTIGGMLN